MDEFHKLIEDLPSRDFGTITPDRFTLFESTVTDNGPQCRRVADFPFQQPAVEPIIATPRPQLAGGW